MRMPSESALDLVDVLAGEGGDAAHVLEQIEDDAFAGEKDAGVVADDRQRVALFDADAVEDLRVADDLVAAGGLGVVLGEDFEEAGDAAEAGDDAVLLGDDGAGGAELGVDGERGGEVLGGLVLAEGLFEEGGDAFAFPVHGYPLRLQLRVETVKVAARFFDENGELGRARAEAFDDRRRCLGEEGLVAELALLSL